MLTIDELAQVFINTHMTLRDTVYSIDTDALVFIDDEGMDTAWGAGAEYQLEQLGVSEYEITVLNNQGYVVVGKYILAFSRYLMETWIQQTVALKDYEDSWKQLTDMVDKNFTEAENQNKEDQKWLEDRR